MPAAPAPRKTSRCVRQGLVGAPEGAEDATHHDRGRALDVVVEARDPVPVAVEHPDRVVLLEVLPLQDGVREHLVDRLDERLEEPLVRLAAQPRVSPAQVERVVQEPLRVGAHVEGDGECACGVDARARRIERELADRDAHPSRAEVAEPEDPLVVGGHDQAHVVMPGVRQELGDPVDIVGRDPQAARPPEDVTEVLARLPDHRGVDDRHQLFEMVHEHPVVEGLVPILERGQPDEPFEVVVLAAQVLHLEVHLLLEGRDAGGEQPAQFEAVALVLGEGGVLVQQRLLEQLDAREPDVGRLDDHGALLASRPDMAARTFRDDDAQSASVTPPVDGPPPGGSDSPVISRGRRRGSAAASARPRRRSRPRDVRTPRPGPCRPGRR